MPTKYCAYMGNSFNFLPAIVVTVLPMRRVVRLAFKFLSFHLGCEWKLKDQVK